MSLLDGLVAYWSLAEASGTRYSHNNLNNLADNATVTGANGKVLATSSQFVAANTEYLSLGDNADISTGDIDFTFGFWIYLDSTAAYIVFCKWDYGAGNKEYRLQFGGTYLLFRVSPDGTVGAAVDVTSTVTLSTGIWYLGFVWHDSIGNTTNIQVDNGVIDSAAYSGGVYDGTTEFRIGSIVGGGVSDNWDGRMGPVMFWKRLLTSDERNRLWNNGYGLAYPFGLPLRREGFRRRRETGLILSQRST